MRLLIAHGRYVRVMDDRENALALRHIIVAMRHAAEHQDELLRVCASVDGDIPSAKAAIRQAFDVDEMQADAILSMQVRRFTPEAIQQLHRELSDVESVPSL